MSAQFCVEALSTEPQHLGGGGSIVTTHFEGSFDAETFDHIGGLTNDLFERDPTYHPRKLMDRARQVVAQ